MQTAYGEGGGVQKKAVSGGVVRQNGTDNMRRRRLSVLAVAARAEAAATANATGISDQAFVRRYRYVAAARRCTRYRRSEDGVPPFYTKW